MFRGSRRLWWLVLTLGVLIVGAIPGPAFGQDNETPEWSQIAPEGLVVYSVWDTSITLLWDEVPEATSYSVYRDGSWVATTTTGRFTNNNLGTGTEFTYSVVAFRFRQRSQNSDELVVSTSGTKTVPAPTGLRVVYKNVHSLVLQHNTVPGADSYWVYDNGAKVGESNDDGWFEHLGLLPGTVHNYQVVAVLNGNPSPFSRQARGSTVPDRPSPIEILETGPHSVTLRAETLTGLRYRYYRDGKEFHARPDAETGLFTDNDREQGATHWYSRSASARGTRQSVWSPPVYATTSRVESGTILLTAGEVSEGWLYLDWDTVLGAMEYRIYLNGYVHRVKNDSSNTRLYVGDSSGQILEFAVSSIGATDQSESPKSNLVRVSIPGETSTKPTLRVAYRSKNTLVLVAGPIPGATEYRFHTNNGTIGTSADGWFIYQKPETGIASPVWVESVVGGIVGEKSDAIYPPNELPPSVPTNLVSTFHDKHNLVLRFDMTSPNRGRNRIYRDGVAIGYAEGSRSYPIWFTDHELESGRTYTYWSTTINHLGFESPWSEPVFVTTD